MVPRVQDDQPIFDKIIELLPFSINRILVVDDEEFCISTMKAILKMLDVDVKMVCDFCINGQEAVDQVKKAYSNGIKYRLILTDFSMPVLDGIQATQKIRSFFESLDIKREDQPRICGVTGHVQTSFSDKAISAGMDDILSKPLKSITLKKFIE